MDRKLYNDDFEQMLKEKSDEFRMYPSKRVWHSIYNDLHPGRKWPSVAVSMLLVIALLLIGYYNTNDNSSAGLNANIASNSVNTTNLNSQSQNPVATTPGQNSVSLPQPVDGNTNAGNSPENMRPGVLSMMTNDDQAGNPGNANTANVNRSSSNNNRDIVASVSSYISSNQLFSDLSVIAEKQNSKNNNPAINLNKAGNKPSNDLVESGLDNPNIQNRSSLVPLAKNAIESGKTEITSTPSSETPLNKSLPSVNKKGVSTEDKAWMEDYALYNKLARKKWKDRVSMEVYATPSIGYRSTGSNMKEDASTASLVSNAGGGSNKTLNQKPALNLEAGIGLTYSFAKNLRLKGGVQVNYTSYGINADQTNHPILTTLMLNDPATGRSFLSTRASTLSNSSGLNPVTVHNNTYQVSIPVGVALKLAGNNKMEWYAGASLQPSFIMGGSTHFISSDYNSYVSDASLLRKWNMNTGVETYVNYKLGGYSIQVGPQLRYQLLSTYNNKATTSEKLYNMGLKVGLVKGF